MFLSSELVDPALWERYPDCYILAGHLAPGLGGVVGHHHVRADLHPLAHDGEGTPGLEWQLASLGWPGPEPHDLDVAGVRRLELYNMVLGLKGFLVHNIVEFNILVPELLDLI